MIELSKKIVVKGSKEEFFSLVSDPNQASFRSDLSHIEVTDDTHFIEYTKKGFPTYMTVTEKKEGERYSFEMKNDHLTGRWEGIFQEENGEVTLSLKETITPTQGMPSFLAKAYLLWMQHCYKRDLLREWKRRGGTK